MKKQFFNYAFYLVTAFALYACGDLSIPDPIAPQEVLPAATGTLDVSFTNLDNTTNPIQVNAKKGDVIVASVLVKKVADGGIPKALEVYGALSSDVRGTRIFDAIDLKNRAEQTKTFEYTVSSETGKVYLYVEVLDRDNRITRRTIIVNLVTEEQTTRFKDITLGGQLNAVGSRVSSSTGDVYKVCDLQANMEFVDITYAVDKTTNKPTFYSNPERAIAGFSTTVPATNTECGGESTGGGSPTYFIEAPNSILFSAATNAELQSLAITNMSPQRIELQAGKIIGFLNAKGKKGLIIIHEIVGSAEGTVRFDIVVQK